MTTQRERKHDLLEQLAKQLEAREQELPRETRLERKGRVRNKYRLLEKWQSALDEYSGAGSAELVTGYRPSGSQAPVDVEEIAGLIVCDEDDGVHHFRLYRDETAAFIEIPDGPDTAIHVDPMTPPASKQYNQDGPPAAVTSILDALEITPSWHTACADGEHSFSTKGEDTRFESVVCDTCGHAQDVLTWLGHDVPPFHEIR